jgi:hypothetical protein
VHGNHEKCKNNMYKFHIIFFSQTCRKAVYHCINRRELQNTHPTDIAITYMCIVRRKRTIRPRKSTTQGRGDKKKNPLAHATPQSCDSSPARDKTVNKLG